METRHKRILAKIWYFATIAVLLSGVLLSLGMPDRQSGSYLCAHLLIGMFMTIGVVHAIVKGWLE